MICYGLEMNVVFSVISKLTIVPGNVMVDAINGRAPPHSLRPHVNEWLDACAKAWDARIKPTKPGRSKAGSGTGSVVLTNFQPWHPNPATTATANEDNGDGKDSLLLF